MSSIRQIEANQRNAQLSTGPRTDEGKNASRRNAMKHGLSGAGVVLPTEETQAVADRIAQWNSSLRPWTVFEIYLSEQIAIASVQVEQCRIEERAFRARLAARASACWDDDRRLAAEDLGENLSKKPSAVSKRLAQTPQGCDWLLERWEGLARIHAENGKWAEAQRALALDLLGVPAELRDGTTKLDADPAAVAAAEIARLHERQETVLADLDADEQAAAELGIPGERPESLLLLRRYEAACQRRLAWALKEMQRGRRASAEAKNPSRPRLPRAEEFLASEPDDFPSPSRDEDDFTTVARREPKAPGSESDSDRVEPFYATPQGADHRRPWAGG